MPTKSKPQQVLMRAAAHTPGGFGGVPQTVGRKFVNADKAQGVKFNKGGDVGGGMAVHNYCAGGKVISTKTY
jgi:hypothetical protein